MGKLRVGLKYFAIGLVAGVLLAPRTGEETRRGLADGLLALVERLLGGEPPHETV